MDPLQELDPRPNEVIEDLKKIKSFSSPLTNYELMLFKAAFITGIISPALKIYINKRKELRGE